MNWNIILAVSIAILTLGGASLASHLAATEPWHKWFFWGTGLLAVILVGIQTTLSEKAQDHLQNQLNAIQKNTENPPKVEVNVPPVPAKPEHTHLQWLPMRAPDDDPLFPLHEGEKPDLAFRYTNTGDYDLLAPQVATIIKLIPKDEVPRAFKNLYKKLQYGPPNGTLVAHPSPTANMQYGTRFGEALRKEDIEKLNKQEIGLCAIASVRWKDSTGRYETYLYQCMAVESNGSYNWHVQAEDNTEHRY